jgi:peptidoglycan/xylan/chitin deacetylase (PgdA/CDA1 family)
MIASMLGNLAMAGTASTSIVAAVAWQSVRPRSCIWGPVISCGSSVSRAVALTFDDGPTPGCTDRVLEILAAHRVPAAFFVIGGNAVAYPELLKRIDDEGHVIGNHSFTHSNVGFMRWSKYWRHEIARTDEAVHAAIGKKPALFRPPLGVKTCFMHAVARQNRQALVTWTSRARDGVPTTADRIVERLTLDTQAGDILLLHDGVKLHGHRDMTPTAEALPKVIETLRGRGLNFVRLDELIGLPPYLDA